MLSRSAQTVKSESRGSKENDACLVRALTHNTLSLVNCRSLVWWPPEHPKEMKDPKPPPGRKYGGECVACTWLEQRRGDVKYVRPEYGPLPPY